MGKTISVAELQGGVKYLLLLTIATTKSFVTSKLYVVQFPHARHCTFKKKTTNSIACLKKRQDNLQAIHTTFSVYFKRNIVSFCSTFTRAIKSIYY